MQQTGKDTELFYMKATQFQIIVNNATTGHKLQGSGVENLFVHNWYYVTNWYMSYYQESKQYLVYF